MLVELSIHWLRLVSSVCVYMYVLHCVHVPAITHPSVQFQTGLEKHQVAELLVTMIQQYSAVLRIQVKTISS